ncbi:UNVERIFIED_CONTAM: DNA-directed RNA polymerase I subunit [Sesamum angustifolium]|uniref:DNA-directed RNA polymerase subunit n=1 Tax=Sesamum angustifolium TaxID=2727405 RepID=A0AAW2PVJ0_9LAMI
MGPLDENSPCKSCGQRAYHCAGHCGHIDLVSPAYNPLLFNTLSNLLNKTCFYCFQFRTSRREVENCVSQLELIIKGDIVGAKRLSMRQNLQDKKNMDWVLSDDIVDPRIVKGAIHHILQEYLVIRITMSTIVRHAGILLSSREAMSVLNEFLKKKGRKCKSCECNNPKINKPTFGWFHVRGLSDTQLRSNAIRRSRLDVAHTVGGEERPSSEVVNASDYSWKDDSETVEANSFIATSDTLKKSSKKGVNQTRNQDLGEPNNYFSGPLLPSEVRDILRRLWENEAPLCSYMCDIQQQQCKLSGNVAGYSMFFLESILVPPIKFRPPAKGGDSVMEHPQTVLLGKVLQSNIALGNAHVNNAERSKIINRWMDLQQSINVLFDSKTANSEPVPMVFAFMSALILLKQCAFVVTSVLFSFDMKFWLSFPVQAKVFEQFSYLEKIYGISIFVLGAKCCQAQKDGTSGICQFLEKKEGIFRQKMMGKRVNFACRSVISPDPYLAVNEIGIPPYFALRLTYPESMKKSLPAALEAFNASKLVLAGFWGSGILVMVKRVTPWNAGKLRGAVINGPEIHPGATTYVDSVSTVKLPSSKKMRVAISRKLPSSRGSQSGKINELEFEGKFVYRHLQDGDIVLVNRQVKLLLEIPEWLKV